MRRRWRPPLTGFGVWLAAGGLAGSALALWVGWSNGFAIAGGGLFVGSVGWTVGPAKTPMAWSEGALMSYQGNAESAATTGGRMRSPWLRVPAVAMCAGLLLLVAAAVFAAEA